MSVFQDVTFEFKGQQYKVEATNMMRLLAILYDKVHPTDVLTEKPNLAKLSDAFAACINYAGGNVTDEEVYSAMFKQDDQTNQAHIVGTLLLLIVPPSEYQTTTSDGTGEKKPMET